MMTLKAVFRPLYAPVVNAWRQRARRLSQRRAIRAEAAECLKRGQPLKLIIGAGSTRYPGWIATDLPAFDIRQRSDWAALFQPASIDRMLAEHVFEHLTAAQLGAFLSMARAYLKPAGVIRIAVPDGYHPDAAYIERVRPGGSGEGAQDHKLLYNCDQLASLIRAQGYQCRLLEHFDASGRFQRREWRAEDGFVLRSAKHDPRNAGGKLAYTSLIVDCWRA